MRVALYQPDIAANVGAVLRLGACLGVPVDIIEPCGFPLGDRDLRRVAMDYLDLAEFVRHDSWEIFYGVRSSGRLVLLTTGATLTYTDFVYRPDDTLLLGRESAGVPEHVHEAADARIHVPLAAGARSLNVATAAAMVLGEALRQNDAFPATKEKGPR
jgi:tRNA (cytidine/uridine-2'-O-)-methyltransferase